MTLSETVKRAAGDFERDLKVHVLHFNANVKLVSLARLAGI